MPRGAATAATEPRYASIEVAWQVLEAARDEEPLLALRLVDLAWDVAGLLAARDPAALLHRQLLVGVRCERARRLQQGWTLIEAGDADEAQPLLEAAMPLVDGVQPWMVTGRLGLAVAMREGGERQAPAMLLGRDRALPPRQNTCQPV